MCRFKSGIILKNKIELAPHGNESHSDLLVSLGIDDTTFNASKVFIRAELTPPDGDIAVPIEKWNYNVDQDITPDWYDEDPTRYENEFRVAVDTWIKENLNFKKEFGKAWTVFEDNGLEYHVLYGTLFNSEFGATNDYRESFIRKKLDESELKAQIEDTYKERIVPVSVNLTSMDGFKEYGKVSDTLGIFDIPFFMKYGENIPLIENPVWTATPNQTKKRRDTRYVQIVYSYGRVDYRGCYWYGYGVRPFFILKSSNL